MPIFPLLWVDFLVYKWYLAKAVKNSNKQKCAEEKIWKNLDDVHLRGKKKKLKICKQHAPTLLLGAPLPNSTVVRARHYQELQQQRQRPSSTACTLDDIKVMSSKESFICSGDWEVKIVVSASSGPDEGAPRQHGLESLTG